MRTLFSFALLCLGVSFTACQVNNVPKGQWRLEGTIISANDADSLYLLDDIDDDTLATIHYQQGELVPFQTVNGLGKPLRLAIPGQRRKLYYGLCGDEGIVRVALDVKREKPRVLSVGGTPINDAYNSYIKACTCTNFKEVDSNIDDYLKHITPIRQAICDMARQFPDHELIAELLMSRSHLFTSDELDSIIASLTPALQLHRFVNLTKQEATYRRGSEQGDRIKDFRGATLQGDSVNLSDFVGHGQYVLLDFWNLSCKPCIESMPMVQRLYDTYRNKGLIVLGIMPPMQGPGIEKAKSILDEKQVTYPQITGAKFLTHFGVFATPTHILIDPEGKIALPRTNYCVTILNETERIMKNKTRTEAK